MKTCYDCLCSTCKGECPAPCRACYVCDFQVAKCGEYASRIMPMSEIDRIKARDYAHGLLK